MNWWAWLILGLVIWALLIWAICVANHRFWTFVDSHTPTELMACTGCQRHRIRADCPKHGSGA